MGKGSKRLLKATGGLLLLAASAFGTYAVFKFTDVAEQLIDNLHTTVVEADDKTLLSNVEANQKTLEAKYQTKNELLAKNAQLNDQLEGEKKVLATQKELLQKEQNYVQQLVAGEEVTSEVDQKTASAQIKNIEMVEPIGAKLLSQVESLEAALKNLVATHEEGDNQHQDLTLKLYNFQKGLGQKSNFKEFMLLIFGLKIVWGLFTGYARTFYPYQERNEFLEAFEAQKQKAPEYNQRLEEQKAAFETETETVESVLKRMEDGLNFDTKIQANFVTNLSTPLRNAVGNFKLAFSEYRRAKEISTAYVETFAQGHWYQPYVSKDLQKPANTYTFWEAVNRTREEQSLEQVRANLRDAAKKLSDTLEESVEKYNKLQSEYFDRDKLLAAFDEKTK